MEILEFWYWVYVWALLIGSLCYAVRVWVDFEKFRIEHESSEEAQ